MDSQQRLMLELTWEAFEDARIVPSGLAGSATAVFMGAIRDDYAKLAEGAAMTAHTLTGLHRGMIANRVSNTLGQRGPSMAVDSSESSSLVAVHLACETLRKGESTLAVAGGVNLNLIPRSTIEVAHAGELSPDGLCFTFDARANGYVRGEGGGAVVLKALSLAVADGDPVWCVILGGAINNDGATDGSTAACSDAREQVLRLAYLDAGVDPADVQYVELHGVGSRRGDPVEAAALGAVVSAARGPRSPLVVGSVKTNIGHLEGAAGIAGLIKVALCIKNREIARSLNHETPSPHITLADLNLDVQTAHRGWPRPNRPLIAGVSSFGVGGTNCHLVISEPPRSAGKSRSIDAAPVLVWPLSARSPWALAAQVGRLVDHLAAHPGLDLGDVGLLLATTRTRFSHSAALAVSAADTGVDDAAARREVFDGLSSLAAGRPHPSVSSSVVGGGAGKVVFVFGGQGSQRPTMGLGLYRSVPAFLDALDEICVHLDRSLDRPLTTVMFAAAGSVEAGLLDRTVYARPALFAFQAALFQVLRGWGLAPDYLVGHSVGEVTAAYAAGVFSLEDAAALVAARDVLVETGATVISGDGGEVARAVRFGQGIETLCALGATAFVEVSPHPILVPAIRESLDAESLDASASRFLVTGVVDRHCPEPLALAKSVARLHVHGPIAGAT